MTRTASLVSCIAALVLVFAVACPPTLASGGTALAVTADTSTADSTEHPNNIPYRTDRSVGYHVLALPAYVLHGVTRPIGWTVKYLEREFPQLFIPQAPVRGVLPLVELGGPVGISGGLALFHHNVFGWGHDVRLEGLFGARDFFEVELNYTIPQFLGPRSTFYVESNFFTNPEDRFFLRGNDSDREDDEARFYVQQFDAMTELRYGTAANGFRGASALRLDVVETKRSDGSRGDQLPDLPGLTTRSLLTARTQGTVDLARREDVRIVAGTRLLGLLAYTHDLDGDVFRYARYGVEVQQYVPVPPVPVTRRVILRGRMEKTEPVFGGDAVPFYRLPGLGGNRSLRGFISERFVDVGLLEIGAEYRYPIWEKIDAAFFVDAGQVFNDFADIATDRFHVSYGGGIQSPGKHGPSFRFEIAGSTEGVRIILTTVPMF